MTLHNDLSDNLATEWYEQRNGHLEPRALPLFDTWQYAMLRTKIFLASRLHLYQALLRAWRTRSVSRAAQELDGQVAGLIAAAPPPLIEQGWSVTDTLLEELAQTSEAKRARLAVFMIPLWIQVEPARLDAFLAQHHLAREAVAIDAPQRHVTSWGERRGVPVIDLLPEFSAAHARQDAQLYLEYDGHWTSLGHDQAARVVAEQLLERGLVPGRSS
jgi:hypothetical protein